MPAGPYLRIEATDVDLTLKGFDVRTPTAIAIEQVTTSRARHHAGRQAHALRRQRRLGQLRRRPDGDEAASRSTEGLLALVLYPGPLTAGGGVAGIASGRDPARRAAASSTSQGDAILQINRTNRCSARSRPRRAAAPPRSTSPPNTFSVVGRNVSIRILDLFELTGDYFTETRNGRTIYGARNATLFLGQRNSDDLTDFTNAVGVRITEANVAVVRFDNDATATRRRHLRGLRLRPRRAARDPRASRSPARCGCGSTTPARRSPRSCCCRRSLDATDDDGDGTDRRAGRGRRHRQPRRRHDRRRLARSARSSSPSPTGPASRSSRSASTSYGNADPPSALQASTAATASSSLDGILRFTRQPNGRLEVEAPAIDVTISVPLGAGNLQEIVKVSGVARFSLGGVGGFQLQDLRAERPRAVRPDDHRVDHAVAHPAAPGRGRPRRPVPGAERQGQLLRRRRRSPTSTSSSATRTSRASTASRSSTTTTSSSFIGAAASNVAVNGAAVEVGPERLPLLPVQEERRARPVPARPAPATRATRSGSSSSPGQLRERLRRHEQGRVRELLRLLRHDRAVRASRTTSSPRRSPSATLASPFAGATLSQRSASSRPWIDVVFTPVNGGKIVGISGDEVRISGPGAANLKLKQGTVLRRGRRPDADRPEHLPLLRDAEARRVARRRSGPTAPSTSRSSAPVSVGGLSVATWCEVAQTSNATGCSRRHRRGRHGRHLVLLVHGRLDAAGRRPDRRPDRDRPADADQPGRQPRRHHLQGRQARADDRHRRRQRRPRLRPHQLDRRTRPSQPRARAPRRPAAA